MKKSLLKFIAAATLATSLFLMEASAGARNFNRATQDIPFTIKTNVTYLPDHTRKEKADLYIPKPTGDTQKDQNRPAMVVIHGGGFYKNDKGDDRELKTTKLLAINGVVSMSINYLLWTNKTGNVFPINIQDSINAVKYLRKNAQSLGIDPEKIGIIGASAGGNLASMVAMTDKFDDQGYPGVSSHVKVLVNMYGNIDLYGHRDYKNIFGMTRKDDPEIYKRFSPFFYVHNHASPTLIIHSNRDPTVSVLQSEKFHKALSHHGVYSKLVIVDSNKHSIKIVKIGDVDLPNVLISFLENHLL